MVISTVWRTAASRELLRRRIGAALLASLFLIGSVGSVRSCPHHDATILAQGTHRDAGGHPQASHGFSSESPTDPSSTEAHACFCADLCQIGGAPGIKRPHSRIAALPVVHASAKLLPDEPILEQPTRHLIPLPNPPPLIV